MTTTPANVSVIICTYNRCQMLRATLENLAESIVPDSFDWKVIVVDNNSTDDTRKIVEAISSKHIGRFQYVFEPAPGKSYALNTGIRVARGEILAFVDDDVTVEPTWLRNLTASFSTNGWAGVGGRTLTATTIKTPDWLALEGPHSLGGILAAKFDLGDKVCELKEPPYGANMAFRRSMFEKYGTFRTDLGPSPNPDVPRPNEDTEFGRRLQSAGERIGYEPSAVVYHPVFMERVDKQYFLKWWFDYGRACARELGKRSNILGISRHYWTIAKIATKLVPMAIVRWVFTVDPKRRFFSKCWVWMAWGQIVEQRRMSRSNVAARTAPGDFNGKG